jgi:hypothetical protein
MYNNTKLYHLTISVGFFPSMHNTFFTTIDAMSADSLIRDCARINVQANKLLIPLYNNTFFHFQILYLKRNTITPAQSSNVQTLHAVITDYKYLLQISYISGIAYITDY